jgi:hypothetical protein
MISRYNGVREMMVWFSIVAGAISPVNGLAGAFSIPPFLEE